MLRTLLFTSAADSVLFSALKVLLLVKAQTPHEHVERRVSRGVSRSMRGFESAAIVWNTHTHTLENAPLGCHLSLMWQMRRSGISVTGTRCPGPPGARTLRLTGARTNTPCSKCSSNECARLRIIPSGQMYVFRDMQVAAAEGAKASE